MASCRCAYLEGGEGSDATIEMLMQVRYKDAFKVKEPTSKGGTLDIEDSNYETEVEEGSESGHITEIELMLTYISENA